MICAQRIFSEIRCVLGQPHASTWIYLRLNQYDLQLCGGMPLGHASDHYSETCMNDSL